MHWSKYLLVFVHWVDENRASCFIAQNALENTLIEVGNPGLGYKKVKPWVWHLPQTLGPELQLGLVNPVQEIHIKQVCCEHWWWYKVQFLQQRLYFLFLFFFQNKKKKHTHTHRHNRKLINYTHNRKIAMKVHPKSCYIQTQLLLSG